METTTTLETGNILMNLLGGLAVFLFGMEQMTGALQRVAGSEMKRLIAKMTSNRFTGVIAGTVSTAIVQSSSVTTVLVVGFVSAGIMSLQQSIPVILGAEIGTTITAQMIAFKVTKYALWFVAVGFVMHFAFKNEKIREYGLMLLGFGLIFYGLTIMSGATKPLRSYAPFIEAMQSLQNPIMGILIGAVFTGIVQSSSATTGIIVAMASQGLITLELGIALAFGANIGTCVTALLAAIGKRREAVRAALVHLTFNMSGVIFWFFFLDQLAFMVRWVSPSYPELTGAELLAAETPRQIANAHTMFNTLNTLFFLGLVTPLAKFVTFLVPEKEDTQTEGLQPQYLDDLLLETPSLALEQSRLELGRLGTHVKDLVTAGLPTVLHGSSDDLTNLVKQDHDADQLHEAIFDYLGRLTQENLLVSQTKDVSNFMTVANYLENIGNRVKTITHAGNQRLNENIQLNQETHDLLTEINDKVLSAVELTIDAFVNDNKMVAQTVLSKQSEVNRLIIQAENNLSHHPASKNDNLVTAFRVEFEIIEYLERVYYFTERIARVVVYGNAHPNNANDNSSKTTSDEQDEPIASGVSH